MKQHKKNILIATAGALALFVIFVCAAYLSSLRDPLTVALKRTFPAAFVGSRVVSINDVEQAEIIAAKYSVKKAEAQAKYMRYEKSVSLARSYKLSVKGDDAADEFRFYTKGNEGEYQQLLKSNYGNSEYLFYKYLVYPQVTDAQLRIKYHSDIKASNPAYKHAQSVLERMKKGEKFEDLAKTESDDKVSGQIGGDLGFYESGQLIPELEDQISVSAQGEVRQDVVISRLGYHLIYPIEYSTIDGKKMWHAKHMLFIPDGYDQWLDNELSKIKVRTISSRD